MKASERKSETEMKRAEVFELVRVGIDSIIETNRADWQFVPQTSANRVAHIVQANVFGCRQKIAGVRADRPRNRAEYRKGVLDIENREECTADRMAVIVVRAKVAFAKTAYRCSAPIEESFIDRKFDSFVGTAGCKRMNDAATGTKCD